MPRMTAITIPAYRMESIMTRVLLPYMIYSIDSIIEINMRAHNPRKAVITSGKHITERMIKAIKAAI